jgi:hypothetical protein
MWIDSSGVARTVALPDPTDVMSHGYRASLDAIAHSDPDALQVVIRQAEEQVYEAGWLELSTSEEYIGTTPPAALLQGQVHSARDVANTLAQIDLRWRLDVIVALDDYLT